MLSESQISASGTNVLKKALWNEAKQSLAWSRFVGKRLTEDHIGLVISSLQMEWRGSVELRYYFLFKISIAVILKTF